MHDAVTVRPLEVSDWEALKTLRLFALRTEPGMFFSAHASEVERSDEAWREMAAAATDRRIFGAFDGERMVGVTGVVPSRDDPSGETAIFVMSFLLPEYRGQGISAAFYRARFAWLRTRPRFRRVIVSHRGSNEASRRANQRWGFVRTETLEHTWPDGSMDDLVNYALTLPRSDETSLVDVLPSDFAEMLRGAAFIRPGLAGPPGGVDHPVVVSHVERIVTELRAQRADPGNWMIVADGEVVGLGGFKNLPTAEGNVEIGYGIAASRRRRGHMTRAVALMVDAARRDPAIRTVIADTAAGNIASQRVLTNNGFERGETRIDPLEGELIRWRKRLER